MGVGEDESGDGLYWWFGSRSSMLGTQAWRRSAIKGV